MIKSTIAMNEAPPLPSVPRLGRTEECASDHLTVVRSHRVLIVEDDPHSRWALSALLGRVGHECRVAGDGREALEAVGGFRPEVILMDMMMPVLDGLEATRRLKADPQTRSIPILALTADVTESRRQAAREAGCDDFVPKPIRLGELLDQIRRHAGG